MPPSSRILQFAVPAARNWRHWNLFGVVWVYLKMLSPARRCAPASMQCSKNTNWSCARSRKRRVTFADWVEGWWPARPMWQFALGLVLLTVGVGLGRWSMEKPRQDGELARLRDEVGGLRELLTLSLLQQQSASERLRGVSWSSQVQQPEEAVLSALLQTLNSDPNVNVRLAALDALQRVSNLQGVREGLLQALEKQKSPLVQITLIDWLVESKERRAVDLLTRISEEAQFQPKVRERARWGLRQLS